jgi:hypothetical protein
MFQSTTEVDPALTEHLDELVALANEVGAEGIFLIRGAKNAGLEYDPADQPAPPDIPGVNVTANIGIRFEIATAGVLVVIRFPASDGKEPGIESR